MNLSQEHLSILHRLGAKIRVSYQAETYVEDPASLRPKRKTGPKYVAEILDASTDELYHRAESDKGENEAAIAAILGAVDAPKPLTAAQRESEKLKAEILDKAKAEARAQNELDEQKRINDELRARLDAIERATSNKKAAVPA